MHSLPQFTDEEELRVAEAHSRKVPCEACCCLLTPADASPCFGAHPRPVENEVEKQADETPRHIDPTLSTIVNLIRRWFISVTPHEKTKIEWPFKWNLKHVTGRNKDQDLLGIRLPLSFVGERESPHLGPSVQCFGEGTCAHSALVIHSIITLVALVRIAESLSLSGTQSTKDRVLTIVALLRALERKLGVQSVAESGQLHDRNAVEERAIGDLATELKKFIIKSLMQASGEYANILQWTISIDVTMRSGSPIDVLGAYSSSKDYNFVSYKGHLGVSGKNGAQLQREDVLEAMAAFALGEVNLPDSDPSSCGEAMIYSQSTSKSRRACRCWPCLRWIGSILLSWLVALVALGKGEFQRRRELYALMTHVGVQRELNELIAAARNMRPWKWLFSIIIHTVVVNCIETKIPGSVALGQSLMLLILKEELSWIMKLREVHGTEAVALAIVELHTGYNLRAKFDEHCVDFRIPLALALLSAFVAFKIAPSQVAYETSDGHIRIVPADSKWAILVIAALTCVTAIVLIHTMNIAMSVAPRLLVSHIRALAGGTLSGSRLHEAVLKYLDDHLDGTESFSDWAKFVTNQAAVLTRLMWPSVVPWPDDDDAKETEKDLRKRMRLSVMRTASPLGRRSMPIGNQGMFTAMVNHEMDIAGIVAHELACSGSDVIMKPAVYASFLCGSFPNSYQAFMERFYGGCIRAKTSYKLDLKRNVYSFQINTGRFILARDSIFIGSLPPAPTICSVASVASPQAEKSTAIMKQTLELWNGALRRASDVTDSGSYFFDYHQTTPHSLGKVAFSDMSPSNCLIPMWAANGEPVEAIAIDFCEYRITISKVKYG